MEAINKPTLASKYASLIRLILRVFVGQPLGVIMSIFSPTMMLLILPYLFKSVMGVPFASILHLVVPGLVLLPTFIVGLIGVPLVYTTLKETAILKKVSVVGVKRGIFYVSMVVTFITIMAFSSLFEWSFSKVLWQGDSPNPNGGAFLVPWFISAGFSTMVGMSIANISKDSTTSFALGVAAFLPIVFLSGIIFPKMEGTILYVAKAVPFNEFGQLFKFAWISGDLGIKDLTFPDGSIDQFQVFNDAWKDQLLTYLYPICAFIVLSGVQIKSMKWE